MLSALPLASGSLITDIRLFGDDRFLFAGQWKSFLRISNLNLFITTDRAKDPLVLEHPTTPYFVLFIAFFIALLTSWSTDS